MIATIADLLFSVICVHFLCVQPLSLPLLKSKLYHWARVINAQIKGSANKETGITAHAIAAE